MGLPEAREFLRSHSIDGWLVADFLGRNPILGRIVPSRGHVTRRVFLWIPADSTPILLVSRVDEGAFRQEEFPLRTYTHFASLREALAELLQGARTIAMEYVPGGVLPQGSFVDGGTLDLVRSLGVSIVPSADLFASAFLSLSPKEIELHKKAAQILESAQKEAFSWIFSEVLSGKEVRETDVQSLLSRLMSEGGLVFDHPPIVAVGSHSSDPHYSPTPSTDASIRRGDWVLVDLWGKVDVPEGVFADITWVGYVGREVPSVYERVFQAVAWARDRGVQAIEERARQGQRVRGWEVDRRVRSSLEKEGLGEFFTHRTGHNLGRTVHGEGANLDGYETLDPRQLLPHHLYTIEPGVYAPWGEPFGVRSEIDVLILPSGLPEVTTPLQREILVP